MGVVATGPLPFSTTFFGAAFVGATSFGVAFFGAASFGGAFFGTGVMGMVILPPSMLEIFIGFFIILSFQHLSTKNKNVSNYGFFCCCEVEEASELQGVAVAVDCVAGVVSAALSCFTCTVVGGSGVIDTTGRPCSISREDFVGSLILEYLEMFLVAKTLVQTIAPKKNVPANTVHHCNALEYLLSLFL
jgi:hypothetical protein